jgi:acyl transferase domain-containing protein/thioesterase domain-containing protein/acyl carrier protein
MSGTPTNASGGNGGQERDIAIIGVAGRFPGARDVAEFWANLLRGHESIRRLSEAELLQAGVARREFASPEYVPVCPVLDDIDKFDAAFFGISPRDASVMDPAHRLFLEVAWQALENSGNTGLPREGRVGVFASSGAPLYWMNNVRSHRDIAESMGEFLVRHTGNDMNFLATRVSYDLDLRGPSINVQTACSSGLVAVHLARQSLLAGECDMALIGGSTVVLPMGHGYHWKEGEILSPDGHCRPYDHRSAGTVFGSGSACVVLKRLGDALDHGDTIIAVIKGSAVNNDGAVRVGYLAPGVDGQAAVIRSALQAAGVPARSISYVEGHGTGTSVGDPIELTALEQAFRAETADRGFCGIGSVKSNIGHLGEAAGVASLIKVALALQQRVLPATLGYEAPNPRFAMADSPFHVIDRNTPWRSEQPLRAGITALGAGGTNCHVVLEEPPPPLAGEGGRDRQLLVLSARTRSALDRMSENLAGHLEQHPELDLGDVAYTLALGRRTLGQRRVLAVADRADAIALLRGGNPARVATVAADTADPGVVFTFPGGGAQYARMCLDLHRREPAFRTALDECLAIVDRECSPEIRGLLFAEPSAAESATARLQQPSLTLPALFAVEYALARLFESWGLRPVALVGHSMGEYVAACLAGVFGLRDGLRLVSLRGRLFERTQPGRMVGISLAEAEVRALMPAELGIAAVNAPGLCVASGPREAIERFCAVLTEREVDWTPIHIDVAAHSSLLDPILAEFRAFCRTIPFRAPTIPIASNLTGRWLEPAQAQDPEYWVRHLRSTVRFADCIETIVADGSRVFLEVGPGRTLTTLVGLQRTKVAHAFNSVRHPREPADDVEYALSALGKVWGGGVDCDWTALYDGQLRNRVPLPGYPFEGQSYWVAARPVQAEEPTEPHKREDLDQWFATTAWDLAPRPAASAPAARWLLFVDDRERGAALTAALRRRGGDGLQVVTVAHGRRLRRLAADRYEVGAGSADQYRQLLELLQGDGVVPERIVMWLGAADAAPGTNGSARGHRGSTLDRSCFAPARLAQVITTVLDRARVVLVSENAFSVAGEAVDPIARTGIGPALVIPRELPDFPTRLVDVDGAMVADQRTAAASIEQLALELLTDDDASVVVLRAPRRWVPQLRPTRLPSAPAAPEWLRDGDVVFVTGGLGGIGRVLARHLAQQRRIRLALLSREALPPRSEWQAVLADAATAARLRERIEWVRDLERSGTEVAVVRGDVTDRAGLEQAVAEVRRTFGGVHVVIHAAGVMNDAPLQSKTIEQMRQVLAPKVDGTLHLDAVVGDEPRVFVVMSSIASLLGLPGQLDYTAANAFLDAFAEARQRCRPGRTLAINWNAWRDVGMVVGGGIGDAAEVPLPAGRTAHPWLEAWEPIADGRRYHTDFAVDRHWLLGEHRIRGAAALIPGTGFVELARAAFVESGLSLYEDPAATAVELRQVTFLRPFQVAGAQRRLRIEVRRQGDVAQLAMMSGAEDTLHMTAELRRCRSEAGAAELGALRANCTEPVALRGSFLDQDFVDFGPRWGNLRSIRRGRGEALLELELPAAFAAEVAVLVYHPAVADMATGAAQCLIPGFEPATDFLVPFGYDRIVIAGPIGPRCTSHVRLRPESTREAAAFDVRVFDAAGREVVTVHGFTMKRVARDAAVNQAAGGPSAAVVARHNAATEALLREAIAPAEGVIAFDRILAQQEAVQVVASSVDLEVWRRKLAREATRLEGGDADGAAPAFSRPALSSDFEAPAPGIEAGVAAIWSKLLGVSEIGAKDDFFELGGNSLIAVRFFTRIKKDFGVTMPLSTLFQFPTIRQLCAAMREQGLIVDAQPTVPRADAPVPAVAAAVASAPVAVPPSSSDVPPPILIRPGTGAPPLFLVHDGLGEVLLYRSLALLIDPVHAVYGLDPEQQRGRFLHTSIAEMARAKVARMRSVQPRGPYLVAGLCAGGVVAFEIARQLEDAGERVAFVGLIDAAAVGAKEHSLREARSRWDRVRAVLRPAPGESTWKHLVTALPTVAKKARNWIAYSVGTRLRRRRTAQQVERMRSAPETMTPETQVVQFLELYENAHREHRATGLLRGARVVLYRATAGNGEADDVPFREVYADELLGWQGSVADPIQAVDIPGGHTSALQEPNVGVLACALQAGIRAALLAGAQ